MSKIVVGLLCIMLILTGCIGYKVEPVYTVIPKNDARLPIVSWLSLSEAGFICRYNFFSFSSTPSINEVKHEIHETVVAKEWNGYYYSKHIVIEHPEVSFYIFYQTENYAPGFPLVGYSFFVLPISSEEVSSIQVGDPYSKLQEQYGFFPDLEGHIEFVHSDGEILFCRIDRIDGELKVVDVRPGLKAEFALMIKEILEFEATLE